MQSFNISDYKVNRNNIPMFVICIKYIYINCKQLVVRKWNIFLAISYHAAY